MSRRLPRHLHLKHGAYYYVSRVDGKVRWVRLSTEYGEALRKWADLEGGSVRHTWTVSDAIGHYLTVSAKRLKKATLAGYTENAKQLIPVFGAVPINELRRSDVYSYVVKRGNVAGNRERALLSAAFAHLAKAGIFDGENPAAGLQFRNPEKARKRYISDAELHKLIAAAKPAMRILISFAFSTGMRQADVLRLQLTASTDDGIAYTSAKTGAAQLIAWTEELKSIWRSAAGNRIGAQPLFRARGGKAYTSSGFRASWRQVVARAGLSDVRFHDLRRKAGSDSVDLAAAQELLGHTDSKITRKHYRAKLTPATSIRLPAAKER